MPSKTTSKSTKSSAVDNKISKKEEDGSHVSVDFGDGGKKKVEDLEVKDAQLIFHSIWHELEQEVGVENLHFPAEIFWLNGAPGAGKGTQTAFIMEFRDLTEKPIIVSELLKSPEARKKLMQECWLVTGRLQGSSFVLF